MRIAHTIVAITLATASASAQGFTQGDLFLYTPAATGISSSDGGVFRIEPSTGTTTLIVDLDGVEQWSDAMAYDPFRDGLLFTGRIGGVLMPKLLWLSDAQGNTQSLGFSGESFRCLAPTGDGRVYYRTDGPAGRVHFLDATNQKQQLMDAAGAQPFEFVPGQTFHYTVMAYHAPTNSLFAAGRQNQPDCSGGAATGVLVRRATLSPDGTRVVGPVLCGEFEVSSSGEQPVGLSVMDDGDLLLVVDTNSNAEEPRMVRIDPVSVSMSMFAANGGYAFPAATNAGTYSSVLGKAVILNSGGDDLRSYASGQTGAGTVFPTTMAVSPAGSSGEVASLIQVRGAPCLGSFATYGDGLAGNGGFEPSLTATGCPVPGSTINLHAASVVGGAPGVMVLGVAPAAVPVFGGTLLVTPSLTLPIAAGGAPGVPGAGSLMLPVGIPSNPALSGAVLYFQMLFADAGAASGLSFTGGLAMTIG